MSSQIIFWGYFGCHAAKFPISLESGLRTKGKPHVDLFSAKTPINRSYGIFIYYFLNHHNQKTNALSSGHVFVARHEADKKPRAKRSIYIATSTLNGFLDIFFNMYFLNSDIYNSISHKFTILLLSFRFI